MTQADALKIIAEFQQLENNLNERVKQIYDDKSTSSELKTTCKAFAEQQIKAIGNCREIILNNVDNVG